MFSDVSGSTLHKAGRYSIPTVHNCIREDYETFCGEVKFGTIVDVQQLGESLKDVFSPTDPSPNMCSFFILMAAGSGTLKQFVPTLCNPVMNEKSVQPGLRRCSITLVTEDASSNAFLLRLAGLIRSLDDLSQLHDSGGSALRAYTFSAQVLATKVKDHREDAAKAFFCADVIAQSDFQIIRGWDCVGKSTIRLMRNSHLQGHQILFFVCEYVCVEYNAISLLQMCRERLSEALCQYVSTHCELRSIRDTQSLQPLNTTQDHFVFNDISYEDVEASLDVPEFRIPKELLEKKVARWLQYHEQHTSGIPGLLPIYVGMRARVTERISNKLKICKYTPCTVIARDLRSNDKQRVIMLFVRRNVWGRWWASRPDAVGKYRDRFWWWYRCKSAAGEFFDCVRLKDKWYAWDDENPAHIDGPFFEIELCEFN